MKLTHLYWKYLEPEWGNPYRIFFMTSWKLIKTWSASLSTVNLKIFIWEVSFSKSEGHVWNFWTSYRPPPKALYLLDAERLVMGEGNPARPHMTCTQPGPVTSSPVTPSIPLPALQAPALLAFSPAPPTCQADSQLLSAAGGLHAHHSSATWSKTSNWAIAQSPGGSVALEEKVKNLPSSEEAQKDD